jgi:hypothetical protein
VNYFTLRFVTVYLISGDTLHLLRQTGFASVCRLQLNGGSRLYTGSWLYAGSLPYSGSSIYATVR